MEPPEAIAIVIMPVHNGMPVLALTAPAARAQILQPTGQTAPLLIIDNNSKDSTSAYLAQLASDPAPPSPIQIITQPIPGPAAARNAGIRAALSRQPAPKFIALIDADCIAPPDWLQTQITFLEQHPQYDAVGGPLKTAQFDNPVQEFIERQGIMDVEGFFNPSPNGPPPMVLTANLVVRTSAFERIGLFDESLEVGEDADWCWRLHWADGRLGFNPHASVDHRHRTTHRAFARMMYRYGQGSLQVHRRHQARLGPPKWDWVGTYRLAKALIKCAVLPFRRLTPYQKSEAPLEVIRYACFLAGKLKALIGKS